MSQQYTTPIFLVGFMASGKSKWGKLLYKMLHIPFVDMDAAIEQWQGQSIAQIFESKGEAAFRLLESEWLANLNFSKAHIIACGGGAFESTVNRHLMLEKGTVVFFDVPFEILGSRLDSPEQREQRPLVANSSNESVYNLYQQRLPNYQKAPVHWNPVNQSLEELIELLKKA